MARQADSQQMAADAVGISLCSAQQIERRES